MKKIRICVSVVWFILIIFSQNPHFAVQNNGINDFPDSYKPYLLELLKKHPNWSFIPLYTNLDWNFVIENENVFGKNLVPKSYSDRWKNTNQGEYNVEIDAGWVDCSKHALEYAMDSRNFINEVRIFQFEGLSYDENTNTIAGIEKILYGTEFYNRIVEYFDSSGNKITMSEKYSDLILEAGKTSKVSCFHLASRIKQEIGAFLSHSSISGIVKGFEGLYNFYNIGATSSAEPMGAIKNGLQYAKDGKGASQATRDKYLIPWNTKARAITGGGIFIGRSYINSGQNTIYLQKFHVSGNSENGLFWHQYMTNVLAPYSEAKSIYNGYVNNGLLDNNMAFIIPIYNNMPENRRENPNILESDFVQDNTKVYANVSNTLNIRTGPSTSYELISSVDSSVIMTRIAKGQQSGELWDKVELSNGLIGYVFHNYLKEIPKKQIEQINLSLDNTIINKGESKQIKVQILPEEAKNNKIEYSSSNNNIATVDSQGNILGIKSGMAEIKVKAHENDVFSTIEIFVYSPVTDINLGIENLYLQINDSFLLKPIIIPEDATNQKILYTLTNEDIAKIEQDGKITALKEGRTKIIVEVENENISKELEINVIPKLEENEVKIDKTLKVQGNYISGWDINKIKVSNVKNMIDTIYKVKVYDYKGNELKEEQNIGTGAKIQLISDNNIVKMEYQIIIYGDVNGDGKINSIDLLVLQRHILEIKKLSGAFIKAGNINKNGKNPSSLDSLLIQRHILGLKLIEQK